jgi:SAM-dependent methyltransferase
MDRLKIIQDVSAYYSDKVVRFGDTPQGVDWNSMESQYIRFGQLTKVVDLTTPFSMLDYGCGYGAYYTFLKEADLDCCYYGYDISDEMIKKAVEKFGSDDSTVWSTELPANEKLGYTTASGIFNVMLNNNKQEWEEYVLDTLNRMNEHSEKGFSFNMLTKYSDAPYMKDYLYYADPAYIFDYCKRNFSKYVALLHDYPLYEFTILVRK